MSLSDKRVVVVGGTSGMGLATARLAAELGAEVVAAGRRPVEERDPLAGVTPARVDTTDEAS
jgi:NAD(P)-dependent dehydrogenase (short-subunit alcohol dehydrogenase family)